MNRRGLSMMMAATLAGGLGTGWGVSRHAESAPVTGETTPRALHTGDETLDAFVGDLYGVISGPAGQERDWDKFDALFTDDAVMGQCVKRQDGTVAYVGMTPEDYKTRNGPWLVQNGFFEIETAREVKRFGQMIHLWSTYEAKQTADGEVFMRGINSIQIVDMGDDGYKIRSIFWNPETPDNPLPEADHADHHGDDH
ncbi:MAG: hypothetical protein ACF8Q5_14770 [Phycisphaerales bacterium JB040]